MDDNKKIEKTAKLIFNAGIAKSLLRAGCEMIDIEQSRENADKTIFVFKVDEKFKSEFERINKEIAASKAVKESEVQ